MNVLIFHREDSLKPAGGPSGYLYNLKKQRDAINDHDISFLSNNIREMTVSYFICKSLYKLLQKIRMENKYVSKIKDVCFESKLSGRIDCNKYDIIHFHDTGLLFSQKKNLSNYKGLVLLTSHSPVVKYKEIIADSSDDIYIKNKKLFDSAEKFDRYAFERADYIIFPCLGAEEPYYHSWTEYPKLRNESKIRYIPTGILPVICKKSRAEIRSELNISEDKIIISFIGRHNEIKGYDILQEIFSKFIDIYVICCGNVGSIQPPKSDRWIEIGWTNDPYSYVGASDIYMLPNRETYFDIAMLQTLSIGKCSVISNTGGNKEFIKTPGVKLYDTVGEAVRCIDEFINMSKHERENLESLQRKEFKEKYTVEVFYSKYKSLLEEMIIDKGIC